MKSEFLKLAMANKSFMPIVNQTILIQGGKSVTTNLDYWVELQEPIFTGEGVYNPLGIKQKVDEDDFPSIPEDSYGPPVTVTREFFNDLLSLVKFAAKDEIQAHMMGVNVSVSEMAASDARALRVLPHGYDFKNPFTIPRQPLIALKPLLINNGPSTMSVGAKHVRINYEGYTVYIRLIEGKYPDYKAVIPELSTFDLRVTIPVKDLIRDAKEVKKLGINITHAAFDLERGVCFTKDVDFDYYKEYKMDVQRFTPNRSLTLVMPAMTDNHSGGLMLNMLDRLPSNALYINSCKLVSPYMVEEPEPKPQSRPEPVKAVSVSEEVSNVVPEPTPDPASRPIYILQYSDKAIAVFGDTKEHKEALKALHCKFNPFLAHNGGKQPGWIASSKRRAEIEAFVNSL